MPIILIPIVIFLLFTLERYVSSNNWDKGLNAELKFQKEAVTEGESASLYEVITNRKIMPLFILQVSFQTGIGLKFGKETNATVSDRVNVLDVFGLGPYERVTRTLTLVCEKRGYYSILKTSLNSSGLFMPDIRYTTRDQNTSIYVYPKMLPDEKVDVPLKQLMGEIAARRYLYEDNFTFRGIRDYAPTDPLGSVNWKATAKTGDLKVNLHDHTVSSEIMIILNLEEPGILFESELLEDCIRLTLTLAVKLIDNGVPVSLLSNGKDKVSGENVQLKAGSSGEHITNFLRALARIDLKEKTTEPLSLQVNKRLFDNNGGNITYVYISSSRGNDAIKCAGELCDEQGRLLWLCPLTRSMDQESPGDNRIDFRVIWHE